LDVAVLLDGYEGGVGRTFPIPWGRRLNDGERAAGRRWSEAWRAVTAQCRPGRTGADLRRACTSAGASPQGDSWLVSVGIGVEGPFGEKERLAEGMVLSVGLSVVEGDLRLYARETVLVTPTGADPLCRAA